jgi:protein involved in polysaccharide export with SLBB domain
VLLGISTLLSAQSFAQGDGAGAYRQPAAGTVSVTGQVRSPGTYELRPAERLSEVLMRAGGLENAAYPYAAVFLRKSAARAKRGIDETVLHELIARCLQQMNMNSVRVVNL